MNENEFNDKDQENTGTPQNMDSPNDQTRMSQPLENSDSMDLPHSSIPIPESGMNTGANPQNQPSSSNAIPIAMPDISPENPVGEKQIDDAWFGKTEVDEMRARWNMIQIQFIDSPCSSVEQGDALVAEVMERFTKILADRQTLLNQQWINHDDITTEELRITLLNYRLLLDHLFKL
jgi:hypothetical protein